MAEFPSTNNSPDAPASKADPLFLNLPTNENEIPSREWIKQHRARVLEREIEAESLIFPENSSQVQTTVRGYVGYFFSSTNF